MPNSPMRFLLHRPRSTESERKVWKCGKSLLSGYHDVHMWQCTENCQVAFHSLLTWRWNLAWLDPYSWLYMGPFIWTGAEENAVTRYHRAHENTDSSAIDRSVKHVSYNVQTLHETCRAACSEWVQCANAFRMASSKSQSTTKCCACVLSHT